MIIIIHNIEVIIIIAIIMVNINCSIMDIIVFAIMADISSIILWILLLWLLL